MKKQIKPVLKKAMESLSNNRGEINYFLAIACGAALLLLVAWPIMKPIVSATFTTIQTWFSANLSKIFTNIT